jgi:hypothetical protein
MKKIKIKQTKQSNGMWGTPINCFAMDSPPIFDKRKYLIFNAWSCAINETFNRKFSFKNFGGGFTSVWVKIYDDSEFGKSYLLLYDRYEVVDDTLYEFENDAEHKKFLRKHKIQQLNERVL